MSIRTQEENFEFQMKQVFQEMREEYSEEQRNNLENDEKVETFSDWLWKNSKDFGEKVFTRFDEWCGLDEFTEDLNFGNAIEEE